MENSAVGRQACRVIFYLSACAAMAYGDSAVCAGCHPKIAETYARTGMGRSFRSVRADAVLPQFEGGAYDHEASRDHFRTFRRDGRYYVRRSQTGMDGSPVNIRDVPVDYVMGSGSDWMSFLHRTLDNKLVEFPVSWYPENGGHLGMSPGYDRPNHEGFSREVFYRCMFCHNGYPATPTGAGDHNDATFFPSELPEGIDCQRCHGVGARHMEAARQGRSPGVIRAGIVNPARLSAVRQLEVCMQCHLETTQAPLPGALKRFNRGVFSYQPGEPLGDYAVYFDHAAGTGHDDKFELISAAYRLRKSACFVKSGESMTCTGCHDPHRRATPEEAQRRTNGVCNGCHGLRVASLVQENRHAAGTDCASCHMPTKRPTTAIHIAVTDHLIQRPGRTRTAAPSVEEHDGNTLPYWGEVALYYPKQADPLYSAVAQVKDLANVESGVARLEKLLATQHIKEAEPWLVLGEALLATGEMSKAVPMYQQAVRLEPGNWRFLYGMGQAWQSAGKPDRALEAFGRAIALAPGETNLLFGLGQAYEAQNRIPEAVRTFQEIVRRNPEEASALNNLSIDLKRTGDVAGAERALREAIRLQPERAVFHMNLAGLLMGGTGKNKSLEAEHELEEAIRCGPSTLAEADLTLGSMLIAAGQREEGRARLKRATESHDPRIRTAAGRLLALP
ncbi:MAG: tetratricopeptide repeat protein [Acidobacteriota bacterium]|nr:tetratricopeptide repeat protein [Acidobacteriota bacterium]